MPEDEPGKSEEGSQAAPPQGSAPETKKTVPETPPQVEGGKQQSKTDGEAGTLQGKEAAKAFFALRQKAKEAERKEADAESRYAAKLAQLEAQVKSLSEQRKEAQSEPEGGTIFDDPDKWAERREARLREQVKKEIRAEMDKDRQEKDIEASAVRAGSWLLSRKHLIEDPKFKEEVKAVIMERYAKTAAVDPESAAELAYRRVCEARGIEADMGGDEGPEVHSSAARSSMGVRQSASSPPSGLKRFTVAQANEYIRSGRDDKERMARAEEVAAAQRNGQVTK